MLIDASARAEIIDEIWAAYVEKVPRYRAFEGTQIELAVRSGSNDLIECFEMLLEGVPAQQAARVVKFHDTVTDRLRQDFMLEELLTAARTECATIWRHLARRADPSALADVGTKMLELLDLASSELERMYTLEIERLRGSREESVQLFLRRIVSDEPLSQTVSEEAALLDYDVSVMQTALVVGLRQPGDATGDRLERLAEIAGVVRRRFPVGLGAIVDDRLLIALRGAAHPVLVDFLAASVAADPALGVGVGGVFPGAAGLRRSFAEATRARAIAGILYPDRAVAVYADLSVFDIFRDGPVIDAFVLEVLGPLIRHDRAKGTQLVRTLATFHDLGMNRKATAARLSIHANTLDYRLKQVEAILPGHDRSGGSDFRVPLALKLMGAANLRGEDPAP